MHDLGRRPRHDDFLRLAPLVMQRLERSARLLGLSDEVRKGGSHVLAVRTVAVRVTPICVCAVIRVVGPA